MRMRMEGEASAGILYTSALENRPWANRAIFDWPCYDEVCRFGMTPDIHEVELEPSIQAKVYAVWGT